MPATLTQHSPLSQVVVQAEAPLTWCAAASQLLLKGEGEKRVKGHLKLYSRHVRETHSSQGQDFKSEFENVPAAHWQEQRRV